MRVVKSEESASEAQVALTVLLGGDTMTTSVESTTVSQKQESESPPVLKVRRITSLNQPWRAGPIRLISPEELDGVYLRRAPHQKKQSAESTTPIKVHKSVISTVNPESRDATLKPSHIELLSPSRWLTLGSFTRKRAAAPVRPNSRDNRPKTVIALCCGLKPSDQDADDSEVYKPTRPKSVISTTTKWADVIRKNVDPTGLDDTASASSIGAFFTDEVHTWSLPAAGRNDKTGSFASMKVLRSCDSLGPPRPEPISHDIELSAEELEERERSRALHQSKLKPIPVGLTRTELDTPRSSSPVGIDEVDGEKSKLEDEEKRGETPNLGGEDQPAPGSSSDELLSKNGYSTVGAPSDLLSSEDLAALGVRLDSVELKGHNISVGNLSAEPVGSVVRVGEDAWECQWIGQLNLTLPDSLRETLNGLLRSDQSWKTCDAAFIGTAENPVPSCLSTVCREPLAVILGDGWVLPKNGEPFKNMSIEAGYLCYIGSKPQKSNFLEVLELKIESLLKENRSEVARETLSTIQNRIKEIKPLLLPFPNLEFYLQGKESSLMSEAERCIRFHKLRRQIVSDLKKLDAGDYARLEGAFEKVFESFWKRFVLPARNHSGISSKQILTFLEESSVVSCAEKQF